MSSRTKKTSSGRKGSKAKSSSTSMKSALGRAKTGNKKAQQSNLDWAMNATLGHLSGDDDEDAILGTNGSSVDASCFSEDWNPLSDLPTTAPGTTAAEMAPGMYQQSPPVGPPYLANPPPPVDPHVYNSPKRSLESYMAGSVVPAPTQDRTIPPHFQPHHKRKKGTKPIAPPKRPLTAYNLFVRQERQIYPQSSGAALGKKWESMVSEAKQEYEQLAEQDVERYRKEMADFKRMSSAGPPPPPVAMKGPLDPAENSATAASSSSSTFWAVPMMMGPPPPPPPVATPTYGPSRGGFAPVHDPAMQRGPSGMVPYAPPSPYRSHAPAPGRRAAEEPPESPTASRNESVESSDLLTGPPPMGSLPLPSGTQIVMPDTTGNLRKYVVNYAVWTMPESSAKEYVQHMLRTASGGKQSSGMVSIPTTSIQHRSTLRSASSFTSPPTYCNV